MLSLINITIINDVHHVWRMGTPIHLNLKRQKRLF
jgi:hypothetical protein